MTPGFSLYLDLFRFLAALAVFLSHVSYIPYTGGALGWLDPYGHVAVMAFFVLSGYVIGYTADQKHRAFDDYICSRLARLYSVVIPAIVLTPLLDACGAWLSPALYEKIPSSYPVLRAVVTLLFMQESWGVSMSYLSNAPLWSVAYEFWYYMIFGVAWFARGWRRTAGLASIALLIGPRILVLLPIWLIGLLAYRLHRSGKAAMRWPWALLVYVVSLALIVALTSHPAGVAVQRTLHIMHNLPAANEFLTWSRFFLHDYLIGLLFFLNLLSSKYLIGEPVEQWLFRARSPLRFLGGTTFSLYVYHLPLLYFCRALFGYDPTALPNGLAASGVVFLLCVFLARFTERKKAILYRYLMLGYAAARRRLAAGER